MDGGNSQMMRPAAAIFTFVVYMGVALNGVVIVGVLRKIVQKSKGFSPLRPIDFLLLNMAASDLFVSFPFTLSLPLSGGDLSTSRELCTFSGFFFCMFTTFSLCGMWLLAHSRYRIVVKDARMGLHEVAKYVVGIWIFALTFATVNVAFDNMVPFPAGIMCYAAGGTDSPLHLFMGIFTIMIGLIPLIGIATAYVRIQMHVTTLLTPNMGVSVGSTRKVSDVEDGDREEHALKSKSGAAVGSRWEAGHRRVTRMTWMLTLTYLVAVLPFVVVTIFFLITGITSVTLDAIMVIMSYINYTFNPLLYCFFMRRYRRAVLELFGIAGDDAQSSSTRTLSKERETVCSMTSAVSLKAHPHGDDDDEDDDDSDDRTAATTTSAGAAASRPSMSAAFGGRSGATPAGTNDSPLRV